MSKSSRGFLATALVVIALVAGGIVSVWFYTGLNGEAVAADSAAQAPTPVKPVEVCMVNDKVFGKPQIPVEFEGKTYYGCCAGCVTRIKEDRTVRYSVDPVTGSEVDKATAVILEGPEGEALYFESMETARRYRPAARN